MKTLPVMFVIIGACGTLISLQLMFTEQESLELKRWLSTDSNKRTNNCGQACLYLITHFLGQSGSFEYFTDLVGAESKPSSMLQIKEAATKLGFKVEAYELSFKDLNFKLRTPGTFAILYLKSGHFVVAVAAISPGIIGIIDPDKGLFELNAQDLKSAEFGWDNVALLIRKTF